MKLLEILEFPEFTIISEILIISTGRYIKTRRSSEIGR